MIATSTVTSQQMQIEAATDMPTTFSPTAAINTVNLVNILDDQKTDKTIPLTSNVSLSSSQTPATAKKTPARRRIGTTPKARRKIEESPISPPLTPPPIPGKLYNIQNQQPTSISDNATILGKYSDQCKLLINNVIATSNGISDENPSDNKINRISLNNIEYDEEQQQQQLGKSDRMSKEKQKFFRHSAFNSDRIVKTSPTSTATKQSRLNNTVRANNKPSTSPPPPKLTRSITPLNTDENTDRDKTMAYRNSIVNVSPQQRIDENKQSLTDESSSSDTSSDDDEDESSSSCSSSSSDDDDDTNSSSSKTSSSDDDGVEEVVEKTADTQSVGWPMVARKNDTEINKNIYAVVQQQQQPSPTVVDANGSWGFAAEAKKNLDIFRKSSTQNERVFGNFDGIDKNSLVKISKPATQLSDVKATQKSQTETKSSGQLRGLFDSLSHVFSTSDYSRSRNSAQPNYRLSGKRKKQEQTEQNAPKVVLKETRSTFRDYKEQRLLEKLKATTSSTAPPTMDISQKTEFCNFLNSNNNKLNNFAINNSNNTEAKEQFGRKFFTNTSSIHNIQESNRIQQREQKTSLASSASLTEIMSTVIASPTSVKEPPPSSTVVRPTTPNHQPIASTSTNASPPKTPRRIVPLTLPLDRKNLCHYNSSSDDDIPYLTPSNLVKNAINSQGNDRHHSLSMFKNSDNNLFGACSNLNNMDFASLRDSGSSLSNYSCAPPPYNKNELLGKICF